MERLRHISSNILGYELPDRYLLEFYHIDDDSHLLKKNMRESYIFALANYGYDLDIQIENFYSSDSQYKKPFKSLDHNIYCELLEQKISPNFRNLNLHGRLIEKSFEEYIVYDEKADLEKIKKIFFNDKIIFLKYSEIEKIKKAGLIIFLKTFEPFIIPFNQHIEVYFEKCQLFTNAGIQLKNVILDLKELKIFYDRHHHNCISKIFEYFFPDIEIIFFDRFICRKISKQYKNKDLTFKLPLLEENFPFTKLDYSISDLQNLQIDTRNFKNVKILANLYRMEITEMDNLAKIEEFLNFKNKLDFKKINYLSLRSEKRIRDLKIIQELSPKFKYQNNYPLIVSENFEKFFIRKGFLELIERGYNIENKDIKIYFSPNEKFYSLTLDKIFLPLDENEIQEEYSGEENYFFSKKYRIPYCKKDEKYQINKILNRVAITYPDFSINFNI